MSEAWSDVERPKQEIGAYVAEAGIPTPDRFQTFSRALAEVQLGGEIIVRSESPLDYDGPSGLYTSPIISKETIERGRQTRLHFPSVRTITEAIQKRDSIPNQRGLDAIGPGLPDLHDMVIAHALNLPPRETLRLLRDMESKSAQLQDYAYMTGHDIDKLRPHYSFWRYIRGTNITVIADDTVADRYHLFGIDQIHGREFAGIASEDGNAYEKATNGTLLNNEQVQQIVALYNRIRTLPAFDPNNCPAMELQLDEQQQLWFLQYHKGRDFSEPKAKLDPADYPAQEGWLRLQGVRGALGGIMTVLAGLYYPPEYGSRAWKPVAPSNGASIDHIHNRALNEILAAEQLAYICTSGLKRAYQGLVSGHQARSQWFKPQVAVAYDAQESPLIHPSLFDRAQHMAKTHHALAQIAIDVASDGKAGYIRISPDMEESILTE